MDAPEPCPAGLPMCVCGARGCTLPGHQLAFVEFAPVHERRRRRAMRHKRKR